MIDLRKYNIKTVDEALEFLELFVTKAPQIAGVLKEQKLKQISLKNRLDHAVTNVAQPAFNPAVDADASVLDRLSGKGQKAIPTPAQSRLDQLKSVQNKASAPATPAPAGETPEDDGLPPEPAAPGEIGQLNIPTVGGKAPESAIAPELPAVGTEQAQRDMTEAAAANGPVMPDISEGEKASAGFKSEQASENDVQPESPAMADGEEESELTPEERAALEVPSAQPAAEDVESVGSKMARKTKRGKKKK